MHLLMWLPHAATLLTDNPLVLPLLPSADSEGRTAGYNRGLLMMGDVLSVDVGMDMECEAPGACADGSGLPELEAGGIVRDQRLSGGACPCTDMDGGTLTMVMTSTLLSGCMDFPWRLGIAGSFAEISLFTPKLRMLPSFSEDRENPDGTDPALFDWPRDRGALGDVVLGALLRVGERGTVDPLDGGMDWMRGGVVVDERDGVEGVLDS